MVSTVALVPATGRAERLGVKGPMALVPVHGVPLVVHAVRRLRTAGCVRRVVVVAPPGDVAAVTAALTGAGLDATVVPGLDDRLDSTRIALDAALAEVPDTGIVLVHDLARAFAPPELIRAVAAEVAAGKPAVVPALPVADTVKLVGRDGTVTATVDRTSLRAVQSPQGFAVAVLRGRPADGPVAIVPGHPSAMKIATSFDLTVAEALFGERS